MNTDGHSIMSLQWMICFGDGGFEKLTVQEVLPIEERETNKFPELNIETTGKKPGLIIKLA